MSLRPLVPVLKNQKRIIEEGWQEMSEEQLAELVDKNNGGNVGVRLDHYAVLDPDEPAAEVFANEWERNGILPPTVSWRTAQGFTKRLYKRPPNWPFESHTANVPNMKIQLRSGSGVQDIIPPSYVIDKIKKFEGRYTWIPGKDPESIEPADLPQEVLVHFLRNAQPVKTTVVPSKPFTGDRFDIESYLVKHEVEILKTKPHKDGGTIYALRHCIFNPDHQPNDASIIQMADGKIIYQCFHDTCQGRTWHQARKLISGEERITQDKRAASEHKNINSTSNTGEDKKDILKALRENKLTPEQKTYIVKLIEQSSSEKSIAERVREFVFGTEEDFNRTFLVKELGLWDNLGHREAAYKALTRLKDEEIITPSGQRGWYRKVRGQVEKIDYMSVNPDSYLKIDWPFRFNLLFKMFPKSLAVIAGATNAGKSSFLIEFCRLNMYKKNFKIRYISSETDKYELREKFDYYATDTGELFVPLRDWEEHIDIIYRTENFIDVIKPNWINIIDHYKAEGEFYDIGKELQKIHEKLKNGIAILALQKNPHTQVGYGGHQTEHLARFVLNIDPNKLTIRKAKNMMPGIDRGADGTQVKFKLVRGYKWLPQETEKLFWWYNYKDEESETLGF
jgi:hypothetical protein